MWLAILSVWQKIQKKQTNKQINKHTNKQTNKKLIMATILVLATIFEVFSALVALQ